MYEGIAVKTLQWGFMCISVYFFCAVSHNIIVFLTILIQVQLIDQE